MRHRGASPGSNVAGSALRRVLVTGATGFIGRAAVADLAHAGYTVRAAVRRACTFPPAVEVVRHGDLAGDCATLWGPLVAGMNAVVHLAGIAHTEPNAGARHDEVNHRASVSLAAAARDAGVKQFILVSSIRAQTGPAADHVLTEADHPHPTDPYGRSKLAAEIAVARSGVPFTILRPVLVYGRGATGNIGALMRLARLPVPLPFGALSNRRSLVSLANLLAAIRLVLANPACRGQTYLVSDPHPVSLADIVAAMRAGFGRSPGLIRLSPVLVRAGLVAAGRRRMVAQLAGELVVTPNKLLAAGWCPDPDTRAGIAAMASASRPVKESPE